MEKVLKRYKIHITHEIELIVKAYSKDEARTIAQGIFPYFIDNETKVFCLGGC